MSVLSTTDLSKGVLTQSNSLLSLLNSPIFPRSSSVRGLFVHISKDFLVRFRLPRGISETNSQNFQDFLATEELFFKNVARILGRVKGLGLPPHPGGGSFFVPVSLACLALLPSLPAACPPAKNRPSVGLELGFVRPSLFPFPWGFYYIACLRTLSSGEQRTKIFIPFACRVLSTKEDDNRRNACNHLSVQKNTAFVGSCWCVLFLLFSI